MSELSLSEIDVKPARRSSDRQRFLDFPYKLYRGDAHWVPPLRMAQRDILNIKRHPFYKTSDVELFLARRKGRVVGRIMAILNRAHNEFHNERAGFFGFFEVENDRQAVTALLDVARDWVRSRGAEIIRGPVNPSTNYECGLLVDGFDADPMVMMTYNPRYYPELMEKSGLHKVKDLLAYLSHAQKIELKKIGRVADRVLKTTGVRVRPINMK